MNNNICLQGTCSRSEEQVFENRLCDTRQSNTPKKEWDELWTGSVFQEGYLKEKITEPGDQEW